MANKFSSIIFLLLPGFALGFYTTWGKVEIRLGTGVGRGAGGRRGRCECDPVQKSLPASLSGGT